MPTSNNSGEPNTEQQRMFRRLPEDRRLTLKKEYLQIAPHNAKADQKFEVEFYEAVLKKDPCNEEVLALLGHAYTQRGDYQKGLDVDMRLIRLRPSDATVYYNLACSHSLLRHVDDALVALDRAIALGYRDAAHILKDPDLSNLRKDPRFTPLIRRLNQHSAADS